jgi:hypothetical protein
LCWTHGTSYQQSNQRCRYALAKCGEFGLTSQEYIIKGSATNSFDVLFETSRVFNNEKWKYDGFRITPKGFNGLERDFKLARL